MNTGILYIVATPIGNLGDITFRALDVLKKVDLIACEDTRHTKKLLFNYEIKKSLISFHQHSKAIKFDKIIAKLRSGENVALVTDAGTPGISDPGNQLVESAIENNIVVIPIPGVSALTALASVSGIDMQKFIFMGFPPHKKGRETFFKKIVKAELPVVFYESPHRLIKGLEMLKNFNSEKRVILGRELTKMFEEVVRGDVKEVLEYFQNNEDNIKGEISMIVY